MKRWLIVAWLVLASLGLACQAPPVRTSNYRRVLIVGDSLFHGSPYFGGNPQLSPVLTPLLAVEGIDVRVIGRSALTPVEDSWARQLKDQVQSWDPDLVIAESAIAEGLFGVELQRTLAEWAMLTFFATSKGADFWRVDPVTPVPGSYYDASYGTKLAGLRFTQALGVRHAASNRTTVVDLETSIRTCPGAQMPDGLHLTVLGQVCVANQLFRLIVRKEPPAPPTTAPPTMTVP